MQTVLSDLRYGARQLRSRPGFTIVAVLTLAIGIGATTAIFSAVNPVLFKSLPYPEAGRMMMLWETRGGASQQAVSFGTFHGTAERSRSFDALAVFKPWQPTLVGGDQPERLEGQRVSAQYFKTLGVAPRLGRDFEASDDRFRGPNVVVLSDAAWRTRFQSDVQIVGKAVTLDGERYTVKGVMPPAFENVLAEQAEVWAPLQYNDALPADGREWGHHLQMVGRLREGVTREAATNELDTIIPVLANLYPKGYDSAGGAPKGVLVHALQGDLASGVRPALLAVLGAVIVVLLIACVNVTNLLLSRGAQRRGEFALRVALGAGRGRLVRQLMTESLLLATIGGMLGLLVARESLRAVVALSPAELPRLSAIHVDETAFLFALGVTLLVGVITGIMPAWQSSRHDPQKGLEQVSRKTTGGRQLTRRTLVVTEVALALVLLVSAGLLLRSLERLFSVDPGFRSEHSLTMLVQESGPRYRDNAGRERFFEQALDAVKQVPGVESAAFTSQLPMSGDFESYGIEFEKFPAKNFEDAFRYGVTPDYFATMGIPLLSGRYLNERDREGAPVAVLLSESLAKKKFGGQSAVGQRVRIGPSAGQADKPWAVVVGVVGNVRQVSLADNNEDAFYHTPRQWAWTDTAQSLVVHARGDAAALTPALKRAIWSVDKDQPIVRVSTMGKLVAQSEAQRRFALVLFGAFAVVALVLAAVGIYGVLAGSVTERVREIGVRVALGASRRDILGMVLRQGLVLTVLGIAIGVTGAVAASGALVTLLFGVSRLDPMTYVGVVALLLGVSVIACAVPALRAANVDPCITLRAE